MDVVAEWTGRHAAALRTALRMTNEAFAEQLGTAVRTVARWNADPSVVPVVELQQALDTALDRAPEIVKARFSNLVSTASAGSGLNSSSRLPAHHPPADGAGRSTVPTQPRISAAAPLAAPSALPEYGDYAYLATVHEQIRQIVTLDNRFGGGDLVRLSARFFRSVHDQLGTGAYDPKIEHDLLSAAGELAELVGWLAYDAEQHDLVRRMNQESLYFTRLSGDRTMELLTLQNASMHAGALGRPTEALHIARSVLEGGYQLSPRLRALFLTRKARALAQGGDEAGLQLFGEIRSLYLDGPAADDPPWAWWVDERELAWHEAMAERDLGHLTRAITEFEHSVTATGAHETRSRYLHGAYLLRAQVELGAWTDAETTLRTLIPLAGEVASTRTVVLLGEALGRLDGAPGKVPGRALEQAEKLRMVLEAADR